MDKQISQLKGKVISVGKKYLPESNGSAETLNQENPHMGLTFQRLLTNMHFTARTPGLAAEDGAGRRQQGEQKLVRVHGLAS